MSGAMPSVGVPVPDGPDEAAVRRVLEGATAMTGVVQPIVDLARGTVVGHELLSRFAGPPAATPDRWFAAAERCGLGPDLAARTVATGLGLLEQLPPNTFLTINLEPQHLGTDPVTAAFARRPRLDRLVVELTEHAVIDRPEDLGRHLDALRERGARIAVDDAGSGYAGLSLLLALRPELVKLDRGLISALDVDPAKRVLIRALGELAGTIDAWVLAEGIETVAEVEELVVLDVPLGQGYLLGRPSAEFADGVPVDVVDAIFARRRRAQLAESAASLQQTVPLVFDDDPPGRSVQVVVDSTGRPIAVDPGDGSRRRELLVVKSSEPLTALAQRVVARRGGRWTDPVVVTDGRGSVVGVVAVPRLLERLGRP